ncbi:hypothetical protein [Methylobacterium sp. Leaf113]|uniref:hypothetical protein n=1 Tax=Methylobacterium sp. Leaf113 TaxID=1736259 RepID=UPI000B2D29CD|nr:hypothetical protein [Methylobacterium sp. Leaf113]
MTGDDRKTEPPFGLDMDFGEALERFIATKPREIEEGVERSKQKKPPGGDAPRRPGRMSRQNPSTVRKGEPNEGC